VFQEPWSEHWCIYFQWRSFHAASNYIQLLAIAACLARLTAAREVPGLNLHCKQFCVFFTKTNAAFGTGCTSLLQCLVRLCLLPFVGHLNDYQPYSYVITQMPLGECLAYNNLPVDSNAKLLIDQWVGDRLAPTTFIQVSREFPGDTSWGNSRSGFAVDDSTGNIVLVFFLLL